LRQIDQQQRAGATSKAFDFKLQKSAADLADGANPAHQVAGVVPTFERAGVASGSEYELVSVDGQRIFARLDHHRLRGGLEKLFDCLACYQLGHAKLVAPGESEYQFFLRGDVFFEFLAVPEIGGLGRSLAKQLARLIVEVAGFGAVAFAGDQHGNGMRSRM